MSLQILTSYHREECSNKGGTSDGSCASGFGVCCICKSMSYCSYFISIFATVSHVFLPEVKLEGGPVEGGGQKSPKWGRSVNHIWIRVGKFCPLHYCMPPPLWIQKAIYTSDYFLSVALSCGGSASENQTYLIQSSVTTLTSPCKYTICPSGTDICRIRFDFTVRNLERERWFLF